jgi:hypothetical protein
VLFFHVHEIINQTFRKENAGLVGNKGRRRESKKGKQSSRDGGISLYLYFLLYAIFSYLYCTRNKISAPDVKSRYGIFKWRKL